MRPGRKAGICPGPAGKDSAEGKNGVPVSAKRLKRTAPAFRGTRSKSRSCLLKTGQCPEPGFRRGSQVPTAGAAAMDFRGVLPGTRQSGSWRRSPARTDVRPQFLFCSGPPRIMANRTARERTTGGSAIRTAGRRNRIRRPHRQIPPCRRGAPPAALPPMCPCRGHPAWWSGAAPPPTSAPAGRSCPP